MTEIIGSYDPKHSYKGQGLSYSPTDKNKVQK